MRIREKSYILAAICLSLLTAVAARADVSVGLRLDRTEATMADSVTMTVSVSGVRSMEEEPEVKGLDRFIVSKGGTASRMEIVNGQMSSSVDYTYFLQPKEAGVFEIGPAQVRLKGAAYRSDIVPLKVIETEKASGGDRGSLFLTASLSPDAVYVEEQAIYTLKLHVRARISDISLQLPEVDGISFKQLGKPAEYQSVYNGQSYKVVEVRYALTTAREGTFRLPPSRMGMTVFQQGRGPRGLFDDPFFSFSQGRPMTVASEPMALLVRPLPGEGRPGDFSGLVGSFQIQSGLSPSDVKAGESATLTITLQGRGNVSRMPDLKAPDLSGAKVYEDQPVLQATEEADGIAGVKTMKWAIVPEKEGDYPIPSISVSYFDPKQGRYAVARSEPHTLRVSPGKEEKPRISAALPSEQEPKGSAGKTVKEIGRDILPVHTSIRALSAAGPHRTGGLPFWIILAGPMFLYAGALLALRWNRRSDASAAATRARKAAKVFIEQCRQGSPGAEALLEALRSYLNQRLTLSLGALTPADAYEALRARGVKEETAGRLRDLVRRLENAVYTGRAEEACPFAGDFPQVMSQIEKELK
jgi:hypothetical protein